MRGPFGSDCRVGTGYGPHTLRRTVEAGREVVACARCGMAFARRTATRDENGFVTKVSGYPWVVVREPRRRSQIRDDHARRTAAVVKATQRLGAIVVDAPSGTRSIADPAEPALPPASFGHWNRPPLSQEQLAHSLWAQGIREQEREQERLRREERRRARLR